ncbi:MAG TPA: ABC transporter permease [Bacillota bacterium]
MRIIGLIAVNQVQRLAANRADLAMLLLLPLSLNLILGVSLQNTFTPVFSLDNPPHAALAVEDGPMARALSAALSGPEVRDWLVVEPVAGAEQALEALYDRRVDAAVIVPADLPAAPVRIVAEPGSVRGAIVDEVVRAALGALSDPALSRIPVDISPVGVEAGGGNQGRIPRAMDYYAVGLSVMMLLFAAARGTEALVDDRKKGVYLRVRAGGVGRIQYLLGKLLGSVILGILLMVVLTMVTRVVYGVHWGDPLGWVVLTVSAALAAAGVNLLLAALIRRPEVLDTFSTAAFQILGFFGGSMMPIYIFPDILQRVSRLMPNRWALDGYLTLVRGGTLGDILVPAAVLLAVAAGLIGAGWLVESAASRSAGEA